MTTCARFLLILLICLSGNNVFSQKVAVVLSGGGAKGLAHVGVLKVLEENNIPIDYIVGTSMGGLVGGFYAAGYSPDYIEHLILSDDFLNWVNGVVNDQYNYYYTANAENASWINVQLSLDSTLNASLNSNIAQDLALNFALSEKLAQPSQAANYNFDSLFIPFRAIAADIFTQKQVILKTGALNEALRATMTVPLFYRPIRVDGKLLFDGGIYNNFPVKIAKEAFDPDIIIGVNVSSKVFTEYPYKEDEDLVNSSLFYMLLDKTDPSLLGDQDIYIEPSLSSYTALNFDKAKEIIDSGYVAAKMKLSELQSKIQRKTSCEELSEKRNEYLLKMKPLLFNNIIFKGFNISQISYVKNLFNYNKKYLSINDIKSGYYKLVSEDYFKDIYPNITYNRKSNGFDFEIYAKPRKHLNIEIGGNISTRSVSQIFLGLQLHHFNRVLMEHDLNFYSGRFYQSASFKTRINFPGKNQFYLEPGFVANKWDYINSRDLIMKDKAPIALEQLDRKLGVDLGIPVGLKYKLIFNAAYFTNSDRFSNVPVISSTDTLDNMHFNGFRYGINFSKNTLNRKQYPSDGDYLNLSLDYFDGNEKLVPGSTSIYDQLIRQSRNWLRLKFQFERYWLHIGKFSAGYYLESVFSNQPLFSNYIGSLVNSPSFRPLQDSQTLFLENYRAHNYLALGSKNVFSVKKNLDLRMEAYLYKPFKQITERRHEDQYATYTDNNTRIFPAGSAGIVYHSPLGPINLSVNYYDDPVKKLGLILHVGYLLYNQRSLD